MFFAPLTQVQYILGLQLLWPVLLFLYLQAFPRCEHLVLRVGSTSWLPISAVEGDKCALKKNPGFGLKEISSCSRNGLHFVIYDVARLFYTSKEIRNQGQSSPRKRDVEGFASNTVRFRALFMWGHSALTSLIGNQKTPYSIISDLHNLCYSLGRLLITQNSYCLFRHLRVFSRMS